jgi:hypothetical protein
LNWNGWFTVGDDDDDDDDGNDEDDNGGGAVGTSFRYTTESSVKPPVRTTHELL